MAKDFRFGIGLRNAKSQSSIQEFARRVQDLGYDVVHVPDHLGMAAPFATLTMAAAATSILRLGTFVLNAGFYKPALLARDVAVLRELPGGRFELGLGAGYVREEFEAAELPFPTARQRIDYLRHVTEYMREHVPDVSILIAGNGDRLLTVAARQADTVGFTGGDRAAGATEDPLAERIEFVRKAAGDRFDELELNIAITAMPSDGSGMPDLSIPRRFLPTLFTQLVDRLHNASGARSSRISPTLDRRVFGHLVTAFSEPSNRRLRKTMSNRGHHDFCDSVLH